MNDIIVALDNMERQTALELASRLSGKVWGFKVNDLLLEYGCEIVNSLKRFGHVFADPKLHDIPNTVRNSVKRLALAGADLITCHVSGGVNMLRAAVDEAGDKVKIIGVTVLTSLDFDEVRQTYRGWPLERFSDIVAHSKVHGVVCSAHEIPFWNLFDLVKVVPGVRPFGNVKGDDQARSCGIVKADYLVIGRPITNSKDPVEAVQKIKAMFGQSMEAFDAAVADMLRIG